MTMTLDNKITEILIGNSKFRIPNLHYISLNESYATCFLSIKYSNGFRYCRIEGLSEEQMQEIKKLEIYDHTRNYGHCIYSFTDYIPDEYRVKPIFHADNLDDALIKFMAETSYECKFILNPLNTKKDLDVVHSNSSIRLNNNLIISLICYQNVFNQLQVDAIISLDKINGEYFGPLNFNKAKQCTGKIVQISSVIRPDSESCSITISANNLSREIDAASITLLKRLR